MLIIPPTMVQTAPTTKPTKLSHPASEIRGIKSQRLAGKRIVIGVTGSIAAVETIKLIREFIRHGAEIYPVMTDAASKIVHPYSLQFASGNKPILELTGDVEHVALCGDVQAPADLLIIAPSTANTISKIAYGIDDTPVTTFATTAIGSGIPIIIVPAMHGSMYKNPIIQANIKSLKRTVKKLAFIDPVLTGGKAKLPEIDEIVAKVIRTLWLNDLNNKKVLVIAGSTSEPIDDVRVITNKSSGNTGIELANNAYLRGAKVKLLYGTSAASPPNYITTERFGAVSDLSKKVTKLKYDIIIMCAAISDYTVTKTRGKIKSRRSNLELTLKPTPKIISKIRKKYPRSYIVGFKLGSTKSKVNLIEEALQLLKAESLDMVVANNIAEVTLDTSRVFILHKVQTEIMIKGKKDKIAEKIIDEIVKDTSLSSERRKAKD